MRRTQASGLVDAPLLLVAGLATLGGGAIAIVQPSISGALIIGIALVTVAPIAIRAAQRRFDPFEPTVVFTLTWLAMFVVKPWAMLDRNEFSFLYYSPALNLRDSFDKMLLLALLGAVGFVMGYFLPIGRRLAQRAPAPPREINASIVVILALCAAAVGTLLFSVFVVQSGLNLTTVFGGQSSALLDAAQRANKYFVLGPLALVGSSLVVFAIGLEKRSASLTGLGLGLIALSWFIWNIFGSRLVLLPLIGGMVVLYYLTRGTRPRPLTMFLAIFLVVFITTVIGMARTAENRQRYGVGGVVEQVISQPSKLAEPLMGFQNGMAPGLAAALQVVPSHIHHTYGLSLVADLVTRPIPRTLWPQKPLNARERVTDRLAPEGHSLYRNPEYSNLLVFYVDWGILGGLLLVSYGIVARLLYEWFRLHEKSLAARLLFAISLPLFLPAFRDGPVDAFGRWALIMFPILIAFAFASGSLMNRFVRPGSAAVARPSN